MPSHVHPAYSLMKAPPSPPILPPGAAMPSPPVRRFTLFDGMVLIAATGVGIAWTRATANDFIVVLPAPDNLMYALDWHVRGLTIGLPCLLAWTVAILGLRLRQPRVRRRLLTRQPGLVACLIAVIMTAFGGAILGVFLFLGSIHFDIGTARPPQVRAVSDLAEVLALTSPMIQSGVLCAWITLALSGCWRPERSWIDRAGRLLGVLWILGLPFTMMVWIMEEFF